MSTNLEKYVASVTKATINDAYIKKNTDHIHECGVNWYATLPADIILVGRVIVKSIEQKHGKFGQLSTIINLVHVIFRLSWSTKRRE